MVDKGVPNNPEDYKVVQQDEFTFYVQKDLAQELDGYEVELSSIGVIFPRYFISSVREMKES